MARRHGPGPAVDESAGIGRVLEEGEDSRDRRRPPADVAEAVFAGQQQLLVVENAHDLAGGPDLQESGEDQVEPALDLLVGVLDDLLQRITDPARPARPGQFAALRFLRIPAVKRARMVCNSSSEINPLRPRIRRPLVVAGS